MRSNEVNLIGLDVARAFGLGGRGLGGGRFHGRYEIDAVVTVIKECRSALESWERREAPALRADELATRSIQHARWLAESFDADVVDNRLDAIAAQLRAYEQGAAI